MYFTDGGEPLSSNIQSNSEAKMYVWKQVLMPPEYAQVNEYSLFLTKHIHSDTPRDMAS